LPVRSYNGIRGSHHIGYYYVGYDVKNIFVPDSYQIVFINQNNQAASVGFHITDSGFISLTEETPYHANYGIRNILDDAKIIITEPDGRVLDTQEVEMELDFNRQVRTQQNVKNLIRSATGIIKAILYNDGQLQVIVNDVEFKTIRDVQDIIGMLGSTLFYLF
jgi:hypothetical protein